MNNFNSRNWNYNLFKIWVACLNQVFNMVVVGEDLNVIVEWYNYDHNHELLSFCKTLN